MKINPEDNAAKTLLITLKIRAGQIDKSEGLNEIRDLNQHGETQLSDQMETIVILENESVEKAIERLDKMILKYPDYYYNYYLKGKKMLEIKRYEEAINAFNQSIEIEPDFRYAYAEKALAQYMLGDKEGACNAWETSQGGGSTYIEKYCK